MSDVTQILHAIDAGDPRAPDELLPLVYAELRNLASHRMAQERAGQTLQPTALVHEAYLRLVHGGAQQWNGRRHFFGAAAEAMRRILVENARRKASLKRGGGLERIDWSEVKLATETGDEQLLALDEALQKLEQHDPAAARLIKLRFFAGLSGQEAAEAMNLPVRSATRLWAYARAWLLNQIRSEAG